MSPIEKNGSGRPFVVDHNKVKMAEYPGAGPIDHAMRGSFFLPLVGPISGRNLIALIVEYPAIAPIEDCEARLIGRQRRDFSGIDGIQNVEVEVIAHCLADVQKAYA
jgi:hypothetical protein